MIFLLFMPYLASALQKLTILGTNDLHGRLFAYNITTSKNELIKQGGLSLFSSYLSILRDTEPNLIWLDGGDLYTGTLES
jgi:5'-nucleotidase